MQSGMVILNKASISWNYKCGLPRKFNIVKTVLGYADLSVTAQEYEFAYSLWTEEEQEMADDLMVEMQYETDQARSRGFHPTSRS